MFTIRKFRPSDARTIADLIGRTFWQFCRDEGTEAAVQSYIDYYNPGDKSDSKIKRIIAGTPKYFVAVSNARIVGVLRGKGNRITNLFVDGNYHRNGLATCLVQKFENDCQKAGIKKIVLRASLYSIPFYERIGFKKTTGIRWFHGLHVQPMRKNLIDKNP